MASFVLRSSSCFFHSSLMRRISSFLLTGSASSESDHALSSHGCGSDIAFLRRMASACAACASSRTYGVMNTRSSVRDSVCSTEPKSHLPMKGMSFRNGIPLSDSIVNFWVSPPKTTVWLFSRITSELILRVDGTSTDVSLYDWPTGVNMVCLPLTWEYSSSTVNMTVPLGLIFGVALILIPMSSAE